MLELLRWFQVTHPKLKKALQECHHNFDDTEVNPYHIEGDCWSHTMLVCKIAELKGYDKVVQVSALLHDIGKPNSRKINPLNKHVHFFGHEEVSATMAKPLVKELTLKKILTKDEAEEVLELILLHSYLYRETNPKIIYEKFKNRYKFFKHLIELSTCDNLGRFSSTIGTSVLNSQAILEKIQKNSYNLV